MLILRPRDEPQGLGPQGLTSLELLGLRDKLGDAPSLRADLPPVLGLRAGPPPSTSSREDVLVRCLNLDDAAMTSWSCGEGGEPSLIAEPQPAITFSEELRRNLDDAAITSWSCGEHSELRRRNGGAEAASWVLGIMGSRRNGGAEAADPIVAPLCRSRS